MFPEGRISQVNRLHGTWNAAMLPMHRQARVMEVELLVWEHSV
jgi:hypothetical protein